MFNRFFTIILCALNLQPTQKCKLNSRGDFHEPLPVILRNDKLLEPNDNFGNINLDHGHILTLSCEGSGYIFHPEARRELSTATIQCVAGDNFRNDDWLQAPARFSLFKCMYPPNYLSERTNRTCFEGNTIVEVGYKIQNTFHPVYESCFNEGSLKAIYSKYTQKQYNYNYQTRVERPFFIANDLYGLVQVDSLFSPRGQKAAVAQLVGPMIDNYINKTEFLARGHLAAKTDFVFAFGQRASFHYVNCAPQWSGFNGGNWNTLEVDLRNHVHAAGYDTVIYTGTFGVTQLTNQHGRKVDIYLSTDDNNNPIIPVPQYFYKVVYAPNLQRGIVFIGINNPHYTPMEAKELYFCEDVCRGNNNFSWLSWHPNNPSEGYTFCCTIPDFTETVPHLPRLEVAYLLT